MSQCVLWHSICMCSHLAQDGRNPCKREEEIHCSVAWKKKKGCSDVDQTATLDNA
jgi:hypothetical protein